MKYINSILSLAAMAVVAMGAVSCSEKDEYFDSEYQSTPIVVNKVYLEDYKSTVPDREVEFGRLGQMLRLEGSGFMGMKKVTVNGYETYFNRNFVTDNSMLITLNSKTPITTAEESERDIIRLIKDDAELAYHFTIRAAMPGIKSISNTLPVAGETVTVYGNGLQETSCITLPGDIVVTEGIDCDNVDGEWFTFVMPQGVSGSGSISAVTANGTAVSPAYFNYTECMIMDFDGRYEQGSWGSNTSMITSDDLVDDPLGQRGKVFQLVPDRILADGVQSSKSRVTECWTAGNDNANDDWTRMTRYIDATTPVTELAFQFDIYCPEPWSTTGQLEVLLINNYNFAGYTSDDNNKQSLTMFFIPYAQNGVPFQTDGWTTVTIPFSEMGRYADIIEVGEEPVPTLQTIIDDRNAASYRNFGMGFVNTDFTFDGVEFQSETFTGPKIYVDSWRVVPCSEIEMTDFPEDEETL